MDAIYALKLYLDQLVNECGIGMKALLMDDETVSSILLLLIKSIF